jgi:tetratricopeptide (TPR) repeat protein
MRIRAFGDHSGPAWPALRSRVMGPRCCSVLPLARYVRIAITCAALAAAADASAQSPAGAQQLVQQARQHTQAGDLARARARLAEAIRIEPTFGPAWLDLARIHERAGDVAEALRVYQAGLDRVPNFIDGLRARARLLERTGQLEQAATDLRAAVAIAPADPEVLAESLEFFVRRRAWAAALQYSRAIQRLLAGSGDARGASDARVRTLALRALAAETDPVSAGNAGRGWERRALAATGRRRGAL